MASASVAVALILQDQEGAHSPDAYHRRVPMFRRSEPMTVPFLIGAAALPGAFIALTALIFCGATSAHIGTASLPKSRTASSPSLIVLTAEARFTSVSARCANWTTTLIMTSARNVRRRKWIRAICLPAPSPVRVWSRTMPSARSVAACARMRHSRRVRRRSRFRWECRYGRQGGNRWLRYRGRLGRTWRGGRNGRRPRRDRGWPGGRCGRRDGRQSRRRGGQRPQWLDWGSGSARRRGRYRHGRRDGRRCGRDDRGRRHLSTRGPPQTSASHQPGWRSFGRAQGPADLLRQRHRQRGHQSLPQRVRSVIGLG